MSDNDFVGKKDLVPSTRPGAITERHAHPDDSLFTHDDPGDSSPKVYLREGYDMDLQDADLINVNNLSTETIKINRASSFSKWNIRRYFDFEDYKTAVSKVTGTFAYNHAIVLSDGTIFCVYTDMSAYDAMFSTYSIVSDDTVSQIQAGTIHNGTASDYYLATVGLVQLDATHVCVMMAHYNGSIIDHNTYSVGTYSAGSWAFATPIDINTSTVSLANLPRIVQMSATKFLIICEYQDTTAKTGYYIATWNGSTLSLGSVALIDSANTDWGNALIINSTVIQWFYAGASGICSRKIIHNGTSVSSIGAEIVILSGANNLRYAGVMDEDYIILGYKNGSSHIETFLVYCPTTTGDIGSVYCRRSNELPVTSFLGTGNADSYGVFLQHPTKPGIKIIFEVLSSTGDVYAHFVEWLKEVPLGQGIYNLVSGGKTTTTYLLIDGAPATTWTACDIAQYLPRGVSAVLGLCYMSTNNANDIGMVLISDENVSTPGEVEHKIIQLGAEQGANTLNLGVLTPVKLNGSGVFYYCRSSTYTMTTIRLLFRGWIE